MSAETLIRRVVRPHLLNFKPYSSARSEMAKSGETAMKRVYLDANELGLGSPVFAGGVQLNRYPDPLQVELRSRLASMNGVSLENIFTGVGSDEVIDLLIRLCCESGKDDVVVVEPTYGVYRVAADLNGTPVEAAQLGDDFRLDVDGILRKVSERTKLVFCCTPNNPTGNLLSRSGLIDLAARIEGLLVVDEAYGDFATKEGLLSSRAAELPENVVILKTLSKAWGLAGIRMGYCVANPAVVSYLLRIKPPYNISTVTSALALDALGHSEFLRESVSVVRAERAELKRRLSTLPGVVRVHPSEANFLLVEFEDAARVHAALVERGVVVRRRGEPRLSTCLRITVGAPEENALLLNLLEEIR